MPTRPGHACNWPGCPAIVRTRFCPAHASLDNRARGSAASRGLGRQYRNARLRILERDGWTCWRCGSYATTADHITPRRLGGTSDDENLRAACIRCNSARLT